MTAWPSRCRRRSRTTSRRPSSGCRRSPSSSSATPTSGDDDEPGFSYVPIDPCQGVIAALRTALGERIARAFIDLETPRFEAALGDLPRPLRPEAGQPRGVRRRGPAGDPAAPRPASTPSGSPGWPTGCIELERRYRSILLVCSLLDWPWIRDAYERRLEVGRARAVLRADPDLRGRPQDADLPARRAAVPDRPVRARASRADARRQPLGRRRQGDGPRGPRPAEGDAAQGRRSGSRRSCSRSTSGTSATSR